MHIFRPLQLCLVRYDFSNLRQAQMRDCWGRLCWIHINYILKDTCMAIRFTLLAHEQNEFMRKTKTLSRKKCFSVSLLSLLETVCNKKTHNNKNARQ